MNDLIDKLHQILLDYEGKNNGKSPESILMHPEDLKNLISYACNKANSYVLNLPVLKMI